MLNLNSPLVVDTELCVSCSSELSMAALKLKSLSNFEDIGMSMIQSCLQDLVCGIFKLCPQYLNKGFGCSTLVHWEMGTKMYASHKMEKIWLCHAAASVAGALKFSTPDKNSSCESDIADYMYGCLCTLLRVHSALSATLGVKEWCQVHGVWMAHTKRSELSIQFYFEFITN